MRIILFCSLIFGSLFWMSCDQEGGTKSARTLPDSSGRIDEIMLVMDENLWMEDTLGLLVQDILMDDFPNLPQGEPMYDVRQVDGPRSVKQLLQSLNTIVYIDDLSGNSKTSEFILKQLEALPAKAKDKNYFVTKDVWAQPQSLIFIYAKTKAELLTWLNDNRETIYRLIDESEAQKITRNAFASGSSKAYKKVLLDRYGIKGEVPGTYRVAKENDSLIIFRQDLEGEVSNLFFHIRDNADGSAFNEASAMAMRARYGKEFVQSDTPGSYMVMDDPLYIDQEMMDLNGQKAIRSAGLWKLSQDFMGGPFINYLIDDPKNKRVIMVDGFVYAPQWNKRRPIRKLDAIIHKIKFD